MDGIENLYIVDNEYIENCETLMNLAGLADEKLHDLCCILAYLRTEEAFLGETAEAVEDFAIMLSTDISELLSTISRVKKEDTDAYLCEIDDADEMLY